MWWHHDWTVWNWLFMALSMALFWSLVILAAVWVVRSSRPTSSTRPTARDALDERFARGEISEDEYRRAREALSDR